MYCGMPEEVCEDKEPWLNNHGSYDCKEEAIVVKHFVITISREYGSGGPSDRAGAGGTFGN